MGAIIGMVEPHKMAFSVEIAAISVIFRKPLGLAAIGTTFQLYNLLA